MAPDDDAPAPRPLSLFLPSFHPGGAERVALLLIQYLLQRGYEVDLVLARAEGELLELIPKEVTVVDLNATRLRSTILPFARYLSERQPFSVQAFMWPLTCAAVVGHRIARSRSRLVLSEHNTLSQEYGGNKLTMAALRISTRLLYPAADVRICVSEGTRRDLSALSNIPADRFVVIYNPANRPPAVFKPSTEAERLWPKGRPRILSVGRLNEQKNQQLLIQAFALVARQMDASLIIVGEGALRRPLLKLAEELDVAPRVVLPGRVLDPWPYYASADLFVLSSDYEGYGLVLVEALLSGLRVVSTDCPSGPREILDEGRYGRLVRVGDAHGLAQAIIATLADPPAPDVARRRGEEISAGGCEAHERAMLGTRANRPEVDGAEQELQRSRRPGQP